MVGEGGLLNPGVWIDVLSVPHMKSAGVSEVGLKLDEEKDIDRGKGASVSRTGGLLHRLDISSSPYTGGLLTYCWFLNVGRVSASIQSRVARCLH